MATNPPDGEPGAPDFWRGPRCEIDRMFERFLGNFGVQSLPVFRFDASLPAAPAVDIAEDVAAFTVSAEIPGMTEQDVQVSLAGDLLTITGEKRCDHDATQTDYHLRERAYGAFRRAFTVPANVDREKVTADFANGVLKVVLPKVGDGER